MWYELYGWKTNPFIVKYSTDLVGFNREKQRLLDYVDSGDICIITGDSGAGKTSLLKWLEKEGKQFKINYVNAEGLPEFYSLRKKIRKGWFKPTVLLLDEAQLCDDSIRSELKLLWDSNVLKSVVIAQTNEGMHNYSESFKSRVGKRYLPLKSMDINVAKELISRRTEDKHPFSNEMIAKIVEDAKNNPRKILENCEYICIEMQGSEIKMEDVERMLRKKKEDELMEMVRLEEPKIPDNIMPINDERLNNFSPMQKRLVMILLEGNRTAKQLSAILDTTEGSVGKQLSMLAETGIVVTVNHRRPKVYGLSQQFKTDFN